jgi:plastocyanin
VPGHRRHRSFAPLAAALGLLFCSIAGAAAAAPKPTTHTVTIDGTRFESGDLTVKPGDTVVWVNKDPFPHTVTSKAGGFDSQTIAAGKSWKYRAAKKGEFAYVCSFHPMMTGILRVK